MFLYLFVIIAGVQSQVPFLGPCPDVETKSDFDLNKYLGTWYEAERYFALFEFGGKCVTTEHAIENGSVNIVYRQTSYLTGIHSAIEGYGNIIGRADETKLTVKFPSLPVNFDAPYWILDTDYGNYSVVWSCIDFGIFSTRNAWILTRARLPKLETMEKAYTILDKNSISKAFFIRTDQKNCQNSSRLY